MAPRFKEIAPSLNRPQREEAVIQFWSDNGIFQKSVENRRADKPFVFLEGPPSANGKPGVHHILSRAMKDLVCRYKTMTGHLVERKGGWDTHGLPVEVQVEKQLGLDGKKEIEQYGVQKFVEKCRGSVLTYEQDWKKVSQRIGFWIDMENPYITYSSDYIESLWWVLKQMWDKEMVYEGHKVMPYCPRCGTALASHEVAQGYAETEDPSVYVKFRAQENPNHFYLVWTTTPWTLPSNAALAVNPDADYALVQCGGETWTLAADLAPKVLDSFDAQTVQTEKGSDLIGRRYEPLFPFAGDFENAYQVVGAEFVTMEDGTGIVHIAPAFGQEDYETGKTHGLPTIQLVDEEGRFTKEAEPWAGVFVKDADPEIAADLEKRGQLLKSERYMHEYPFCWRCDSPLLYYPRSSWFIKTTAYKDRMMELNEQVNWRPDHIRRGRFGDWLKNNVDWALSRERYWGTPLPIWRCGDCGKTECFGSVAELKKRAVNFPENLDLHRPYIDDIIVECADCGGEMRRIPEVADVWFDSGCAHTAQWHAPFENEQKRRANYPADFISEAIDQTRGWFYNLLATGAFLYDEPAYRNCLCLEFVLGEDGQKMSKSRGNAVDPWTVLNKHGADALRWNFYTSAPPWQPRRYSEAGVAESLNKYLGTLQNMCAFFAMYANAENVDPTKNAPPVQERPAMDRWAVSRFHSTAREVFKEMEEYQVTRAARTLQRFVDDLSNWYVRRSRSRFWGSADEADALAAFATLHETLTGTALLTAPFTPFAAEEIHQNLVCSVDPDAPESVHLCSFPAADERLMDADLERAMETARRVTLMGRAARNDSKIRTRQPLSRLILGGFSDAEREAMNELTSIALEELNVKTVEWGGNLSDFAAYEAKPNFKTLGPKHGKAVQQIARAVQTADAAQLKREADEHGQARVQTEAGEFVLEPDDFAVSMRSREGYAVVKDGAVFAALDLTMTPELILEGRARELVNRIQAMRKEAGFHVTDRIALTFEGDGDSKRAFENLRDDIMRETLAVQIDDQPKEGAHAKEAAIDGDKAVLSVRRISA